MEIEALVVLKSLKGAAKAPIKQVTSLDIKTKEDYNHAATLVKQLKVLSKQAQVKKEAFTVPLKKLLKDVEDLFKPFQNEVSQVEADTKNKMMQFINAQDAEVKKLEKKFEDGDIKTISTLVKKISHHSIQNGAAQVRLVWTAVPVDIAKTPREYLVPNESAIREALKAGKKVNGWRWEQVKSLSI